MPTIKIVPMPGVSVPGPQGPAGQPGPVGPKGAGFEPVTLIPNGPLGFFLNPEGSLSEAWGFATNVRVSTFSNRDKYIEGYIANINHEAGTVGITVQHDFTGGDYSDQWVMELTGVRGADANTGNFEFNGNTISTDEDMTITVNGVPGKVNIGGYLGVDLQFANTPGAGLKFPDDTVQTTAYVGGADAPKTWTADNGSAYAIHQAHGGVEVVTEASTQYVYGNALCAIAGGGPTAHFIIEQGEPQIVLESVNDGVTWQRKLSIEVNGIVYNVTSVERVDTDLFLFRFASSVPLQEGNVYTIVYEYGGAPVSWWNADSLGIVPEGDEWKFRGAKIDYHAYSANGGTVIGTIYLAHDSGDHNTTHVEVASGGNNLGATLLWKRNPSNFNNERALYAYMLNGSYNTIKIHWTAQVYYGTEVWD